MKSVILPGVSVHGNVEFSNGVQALFRGDIGEIGGATSNLIISGATPAKQVTLGRVNDLDITAGGIGTLAVIDWNTDNTDTILAQYITNLKALGAPRAGIAGDFESSISLSGTTSPKGVTLGEVSIAGNITGGTCRVDTGSVTSIKAETAQAWKFNVVAGSVGSAFFTGGKDLPGFLAGDKSSGGYTMRATSFDKIVVAGDVDAKIVATGADKKDIAIDTFIADSVRGAVLETPQGGIDRIDVSEWVSDGSITAKWIGFLKTDKNLSGNFEADVTVTGERLNGDAYGLGNAAIKGIIKNATWNITSVSDIVANGMEGTTVNVVTDLDYLVIGSKGFGSGFISSNTSVAGVLNTMTVADADDSNTGAEYGVVAGDMVKCRRFADNELVVSLPVGRRDMDTGIIDQIGKYRVQVTGNPVS